MSTGAEITRLFFFKANGQTFLLHVYHLNINRNSEVEICSYDSVTSALNGVPTSLLPGKRLPVFIELEVVRVGLRAILNRKFFSLLRIQSRYYRP